jgi:choline dehydrogenase-like flavoprotein
VGSGFCELGCSFDAKQNALKMLIPEVDRRGAEVLSDCRADLVLTSRGRVTGVEASLVDDAGGVRGRVSITARAVCLAGSAVGSAALALRSLVADPYFLMGTSLRLHPGAAVAGVFDEPIEGWRGIPQVFECTELLRFEPGAPERIWIVPAFAHPVGTASMLPGFGADHARQMSEYRHTAVLTAMLHDASRGRVVAPSDPGSRPRLSYEMSEDDRQALVTGIQACARILLAAGARKVVVPYVRPLTVTSTAGLDDIARIGLGSPPMALTSVHPMGTLWMGADPRTSVCDSFGRHHQTRGLYVCDGSLFPTSIGVPPQISIYTFARRVAATVISDFAG